MTTRTRRPATLSVLAAAFGSLALTVSAAAQTPQLTQPANQSQPAPKTVNNLIVDGNLTSVSAPHMQACQQGFEAHYGVPEGVDPDEALIIRGARQTMIEDKRVGDAFGSTLEIAMPFERVLPPGPPDGAVVTGKITCYFAEAETGGFPLTPYAVQLEEEGNARTLTADELSRFN